MINTITLQDSKTISELTIDNNFDAREGTFMYYIHENNIFDGRECFKLIEAIRNIALKYNRKKPLPREISRKISFLNTQFNQKIFYYLNDKFKEDFDNHVYLEHYKYLERFCDAVEGFFVGFSSSENSFDPFENSAKL